MSQRWQAWAVAAICVGLLGLGFLPEIASAVSTWNASTAYGHCWLVLPIVGWLLWERRAVIQAGIPRPAFWPVLLALPGVLVWSAAAWLGVMEGRQLAFVGLVEVLLMAALGWRLWWALSPAFLYLLFLVPFGAFLTPALQSFTTQFILVGLRLFDIPFDADTFRITIPEGVFYVAEACAGLRFLIASVAFGVLYAITLFRSPGRRAIFIVISFVVPIVANGIRGLGIVLLGHWLGSAEAGAADHLIYGWVFFSSVILLLALAGIPFRQDEAVRPALPPASSAVIRPAYVLLACIPVMAAGLAGPAAARLMEQRATSPLTALVPPVNVPANCRAGLSSVSGAVGQLALYCGASEVKVLARTMPAFSNPARLLEAASGLAVAGLGGDVDAQSWQSPAGDRWMTLSEHGKGNQAAFAVVIDHQLVLGGLRDRLHMAVDGLRNAHPTPIAVAVRLTGAIPDDLSQLQAFLTAQGKLRNMP